MRPPEAVWIYDTLSALEPGQVSPLLHLGSSSAEYRELKKSHIERELFAPLRARGIEVVHADLAPAPGVDMVGDVFDPQFVEKLKERGFRGLICANLLEHVRDPAAVARTCMSIVGPGGHIVVSTPFSYPYHADPIDTMYRPSKIDLMKLFKGAREVRSASIADGTLLDEIRKGNQSVPVYFIYAAYRILSGLWRPKVALSQLHRLSWLKRPFVVVCMLLQMPMQPKGGE